VQGRLPRRPSLDMPPLAQVPRHWVSEDGYVVEVPKDRAQRPTVRGVGDISGAREVHGIRDGCWPVKKARKGMTAMRWHLSCELCYSLLPKSC
jgi:hypothetical protein